MKYKLIAVDMDGTLLNSSKQITDKTADTVRRAIEQGVIFTLSTGRPIRGVEKYRQQLDLKFPIITYNGAMVVQGDTNEVVYSVNLEENDAVKIWQLGNSYGTTMCVWSNNTLYCNVLNERSYDYSKLTGIEPQLLTDISEILSCGVTKILWYDDVDVISKWQREIQPEYFDSVTFCTSQPIFLEFFNSKVSKAVAMEKIGEMYGVSSDEMIAIGDGFNDLSMIDYAGLGVAMANAPDEVKSHADYVTLSNDEDGVSHVIEKFVLG